MSKPGNDKMQILKKVFLVLLVLDAVELILTAVNLLPGYKELAEYGQAVLVIAGVIAALILVALVIEILAKVFLVRSTSPEFSWESGRKGYVRAAKVLLVFNIGTVVLNLLAVGGEGATLLNQGRLYLNTLASAAEAVAVFIYLRTVKKLNAE